MQAFLPFLLITSKAFPTQLGLLYWFCLLQKIAIPAYKYTLKNGKTLWYGAFNYTDWTGKYKHTCKRDFKTQWETKEYERSFFDQQNNTSDILFS
jgi:hypothetical protein